MLLWILPIFAGYKYWGRWRQQQQVLLEQEISRAAARKALVAAEAREAAQTWGPGSAAGLSAYHQGKSPQAKHRHAGEESSAAAACLAQNSDATCSGPTISSSGPSNQSESSQDLLSDAAAASQSAATTGSADVIAPSISAEATAINQDTVPLNPATDVRSPAHHEVSHLVRDIVAKAAHTESSVEANLAADPKLTSKPDPASETTGALAAASEAGSHSLSQPESETPVTPGVEPLDQNTSSSAGQAAAPVEPPQDNSTLANDVTPQSLAASTAAEHSDGGRSNAPSPAMGAPASHAAAPAALSSSPQRADTTPVTANAGAAAAEPDDDPVTIDSALAAGSHAASNADAHARDTSPSAEAGNSAKSAATEHDDGTGINTSPPPPAPSAHAPVAVTPRLPEASDIAPSSSRSAEGQAQDTTPEPSPLWAPKSRAAKRRGRRQGGRPQVTPDQDAGPKVLSAQEHAPDGDLPAEFSAASHPRHTGSSIGAASTRGKGLIAQGQAQSSPSSKDVSPQDASKNTTRSAVKKRSPPRSQNATPSKRSPSKKSLGRRPSNHAPDASASPKELPLVRKAPVMLSVPSGREHFAAQSQQQQQQSNAVDSRMLALQEHATPSASAEHALLVNSPHARTVQSKGTPMQEPDATKTSATLGSEGLMVAEPASGHRSSPSRDADGRAEPPQLASEVLDLQDETRNAPASSPVSHDALKAHHGAGYASEEGCAQELPPQGQHGFTHPFAFRHSPTSPRSHNQEADIIMTPDFSGLLQIAPSSMKGPSGQDLTGDQHLTAQPLSQRATHATHLVQPMTAVPAAMVSAQTAAPTYFQRDAPVPRPPSQHRVAEPDVVDRALSPTQQLQGWCAHESGGAVQPPTTAQKLSFNSGRGQENFAPQQQQGSDDTAHIRSFQDIVGRGDLERRPAETLNLPHLKVMESFLQRHEQEQGRLQDYSPLQSEAPILHRHLVSPAPTDSPRIGAHFGSHQMATVAAVRKPQPLHIPVTQSPTHSHASTTSQTLGPSHSNTGRPARQLAIHTHPSLAPSASTFDIPLPQGSSPVSVSSSRASSSTLTPEGFGRDRSVGFGREGGVTPRTASVSHMMRAMSNPMRGNNPAGSPSKASQDGSLPGHLARGNEVTSKAPGRPQLKLPLKLPLPVPAYVQGASTDRQNLTAQELAWLATMPNSARSAPKTKTSLSKLVPKKSWIPGVSSKKQRGGPGSEASDTPRHFDQGPPSESPYGNPDIWSSDGWKGPLDTARSDFSSIPSDTSSPRQWDMEPAGGQSTAAAPSGLRRSSSMRKALKSALSFKGSHKEADGGAETPRDAPSKRTSSFSSMLTPRLSFSRSSKKSKEAKSKLQQDTPSASAV
ncbi:hypothetical protein WJX74_002795 [Apatococcus lobatus]|uniref:Proteophosphoglycan ppg4 n=1 Tax=Apatococcus lobatus TaxID=904363 RepID=A0AAW1R2A7_9CHLO